MDYISKIHLEYPLKLQYFNTLRDEGNEEENPLEDSDSGESHSNLTPKDPEIEKEEEEPQKK